MIESIPGFGPVRLTLRAVALAFLLCVPLAILVGVAETTLTLRDFAPSVLELLYGIDIHLWFAFVSVFGAGFLLFRASSAVLAPVAIGVFLSCELIFTASFWILKAAWAPPLASLPGKLFAAAVPGTFALMGGAIIWLAHRASSGARWRIWALGRGGIAGLLFTFLFLATNAALVVVHYPGAQRHGESERVTPSARPADVILILVDTLRRDHLSYFGYRRPTSPNLDALFSQSYVFSSAYTPSNKTVPTMVSLFTGLYPTSHGVVGPYQGYPRELPTLADHFRRHGYTTAAFVANQLVSVRQGFGRGFDHFFPRGLPWWTYHGRTGVEAALNRFYLPRDADKGDRLNRELFAWLASESDGARFVYLHYMEPHSDYAPPQRNYAAVAADVPRGLSQPPMFHDFAENADFSDWESLPNPPVLDPAERTAMIAAYDGEVHRVDELVGEVLEHLESTEGLDRYHIVFLTDHGEEFGDHGGWFHGHSIFEELTATPLAYRPPGGLEAGMTIDRPVSLLDFVATLLARLSLEPMANHQGAAIENLWPGNSGPDSSQAAAVELGPKRSVVSSLPPQLYSCRLGPWKLIRRGDPAAPEDRLYHLIHDSRETTDLSATYPDTLALLRRQLEAILTLRQASARKDGRSRVDPETLERLRSLGYVD